MQLPPFVDGSDEGGEGLGYVLVEFGRRFYKGDVESMGQFLSFFRRNVSLFFQIHLVANQYYGKLYSSFIRKGRSDIMETNEINPFHMIKIG